jgi:type III pantothenate kinase
MRQLLVDIGNGRIKLALADVGGGIMDHRDLPTDGLTAEGLRRGLAGWCYDEAVLCSVVPVATEVCREVLGPGLLELTHQTLRGIGIRYPQPEKIGPDRLANALALAHGYGAPGVVIDFGTAVTFDVLSEDGYYVGGVIAPGLRLMTDYLHERTALLPLVELKEPQRAIGQSTVEAIQAGAAIGYRAMVQGILRAVRADLGKEGMIHVVATGGDAGWIVGGLEERIQVNADLTLQGLQILGNLHRS